MTGRIDDLRGSEGKRCIVVDLSRGQRHAGTIVELRESEGKVHVRYDDGRVVSVGHSFVMLDKEKP